MRTGDLHGSVRIPAGDRAHIGRLGRAWPYLCAFGLYGAIALAIWWRLLAHGIGAALPAGSADPAQEVWFLAWVPHALGAGLDPFSSHTLFAPRGVNLLDNTSMDLLGLLLAPVTVTAGPIAALDVAVLLAPALSALGAFTLCRRHVTWAPAAFAGGLCYGFGPFLTGDLRYGHLDLTWLVLPPLVFCCLDALLVRGTRRPLLVGTALGVLLCAQFFVSTELLAITAMTAVVVAVGVAAGWPRAALRRLGDARRALALAAAIVVAALTYPLWFVVAGPRHVLGPVWPRIGTIATSLAATVEPHGELPRVAFISGSNGGYLGFGLLAVLMLGATALWRSRVLRVALLTAFVAYVASLGYELHVGDRALDVALPAAVLGHVPLLDSIVPERFASMVDLFCGLALAVVLDHVRRWERPTARRPRGAERGDATVADEGSGHRARPGPPARPVLVLLAGAVGACAIAPFVGVPPWPYAVTAVPHAALFAGSASSLSGVHGPEKRAVPDVAIFPDAPAWTADEMVFQAEDGFSFVLPDGYAIVPEHGGRAGEAPPVDALWLVFAAATLHRLHLPLTPTTRRAVRGDLQALGVDDVVVLPGAAGSRVARKAIGEVLGPPEPEPGGADLWRVANAAGDHHRQHRSIGLTSRRAHRAGRG